MSNKIEIVAIKILDRIKEASRLQKVLSKHSDVIKTRFGYHELNDFKCSRNGLVILELEGNEIKTADLIADLKEIGGIITEVMTFNK